MRASTGTKRTAGPAEFRYGKIGGTPLMMTDPDGGGHTVASGWYGEAGTSGPTS